MKLFPLPLLALLVASLLAPYTSHANNERILNFHSQIEIHEDASVAVTETITVQASGREIKRGIYRWLPTRYKDRFGNTMNVRYEVLSVQRDGRAEPFHTVSEPGKIIVYAGDKDVFLKPGQYTYTFSYRTWRQIGYFDTFDELYWNVTGNYWSFPIEQASCTIVLPKGASVVQQSAYTGEHGQQGRAYVEKTDDAGNLVYATTAPLFPGQGLTVAVAWPKGFVYQPSQTEEMRHFLTDNLSFVIACTGTILVLLLYLWTWNRVGRDPLRGTIVPLFSPPKNLSPAAARFIMRMGFDNKAFAAAVIDMAVKGHLRIEEQDKIIGTGYTLTRLHTTTKNLSKGEQGLSRALFKDDESVKLDKTNHLVINKALKSLKSNLKAEYEAANFTTNSGWLVPGVALSFLTMLASAGFQDSEFRFPAMFIVAWLSFWTIGCVSLAQKAVTAWKSGSKGMGLFFTLFSLPFFGGEIGALVALSVMTSIPTALCMVVLIGCALLFYHLLKAPTYAGRRLMDEIEGFKLFLSVSEKERMELLHPPDRTPMLFEQYLPYALALDVENQWCEQFAEVLSGAGDVSEGAYHPGWYHGTSWSTLGASGLASSIGASLAGAVASSAATSGSGSGGGGFSGGGGGGGGGGGW